jgi:hypothetical protein
LEERAYKASAGGFADADTTDDRLKAEWVVHAPGGGVVRLTARHDRAGKVAAEVTLGE